MLRIRFHGRGGHGMKTASRIVGTAAFRSGLQAQDSPLYGAERRGAAMTAFTRIDDRPIGERGTITNPDLILIADETLLLDPAVSPLAGSGGASGIFVNSSRDPAALAAQHHVDCVVQRLDLTALTTSLLGRASALSAPIGAVACAMTGRITLQTMADSVHEELEGLHLPSGLVDKNVELARMVFQQIHPIEIISASDVQLATPMHTPELMETRGGVPVIYAPGNSTARHTGSWRLFRPVIDFNACTRCRICQLRCPDAAITLDAGGYPVIDYDNCKGCMICARECPLRCILEEKEVRAW